MQTSLFLNTQFFNIQLSNTHPSHALPQQEGVSVDRTPQRDFAEETFLLKDKRVVIVEDEGITLMQLRKILTREGVAVVSTAMSGAEGVANVLRETPDLVLMDIRMPGEYNGLEAVRRILAQKSVCIVMLTAFSDEEVKEQARQIGASGYVVKPIDRDALLPQLEAAYQRWRPQ